MSETPRERLDRLIREGPPPITPKPKPLPEAAEVVPFDPWGPRRPWRAEPMGTVNSIPYEPTALDRVAEVQRTVAAAARADRRRRDPFGLALYGDYETTEDLVRRQNGE